MDTNQPNRWTGGQITAGGAAHISEILRVDDFMIRADGFSCWGQVRAFFSALVIRALFGNLISLETFSVRRS